MGDLAERQKVQHSTRIVSVPRLRSRK